jgi:SAM-dependent methyltransferase
MTGMPRTAAEVWRRLFLHNVAFSDNHGRLDALYVLKDPWKIDTPKDQSRLRSTNDLISRNFGHVRRLLEVGCGEGYQSRELLKICDELIGVDVSRRAVRRAQRLCPDGTFLVGDIFSDVLVDGQPFDLVVACEVLYYMKDVASALEQLSELGVGCVVSYYMGMADRLDPFVLQTPGVRTHTIRHAGWSWKVAWWRMSRRRPNQGAVDGLIGAANLPAGPLY